MKYNIGDEVEISGNHYTLTTRDDYMCSNPNMFPPQIQSSIYFIRSTYGSVHWTVGGEHVCLIKRAREVLFEISMSEM